MSHRERIGIIRQQNNFDRALDEGEGPERRAAGSDADDGGPAGPDAPFAEARLAVDPLAVGGTQLNDIFLQQRGRIFCRGADLYIALRRRREFDRRDPPAGFAVIGIGAEGIVDEARIYPRAKPAERGCGRGFCPACVADVDHLGAHPVVAPGLSLFAQFVAGVVTGADGPERAVDQGPHQGDNGLGQVIRDEFRPAPVNRFAGSHFAGRISGIERHGAVNARRGGAGRDHYSADRDPSGRKLHAAVLPRPA